MDSGTILEPTTEARNARRLETHDPTAFEAALLIKPPALRGVSDGWERHGP
jgi:hypothetical protein